MATVSLRIDKNLIDQVSREAKIQNRSRAKQLEHWAKAGRIILSKIDITDIYAVSQGLKSLKIEIPPSVQSIHIDTDDVLADLENDRASGSLSNQVTTAQMYYEESVKNPGYLDQVNTVTGERTSGSFQNGEFKVIG